jgi:DNA-binding transcriptional LysR family regulator
LATPLANLDWDDLRVFLEAARSRSVTRAARQLGIDHSTVSRRLSRLEYAVGAGLFERNREGLALTALGATVLRRAEELAAGIHNLRADMTGAGDVGGTVRLATMEGIASLYLAPRLAALQATAPGLHVELVTSPQMVRVTRREADLFLSFFRPPGRGIACDRIGGFRTGLYAAPAYLERCGTSGDPASLAHHRFVGYVEELIQVEAVRWLEELVASPRLVFTSNSMIAQMGAAAGGLGIVALPLFAVNEASGLVPVLPSLSGRRDLWLSGHPDTRGAPRIKALTQFLRGLIAADADAFVP